MFTYVPCVCVLAALGEGRGGELAIDVLRAGVLGTLSKPRYPQAEATLLTIFCCMCCCVYRRFFVVFLGSNTFLLQPMCFLWYFLCFFVIFVCVIVFIQSIGNDFSLFSACFIA